MLKSFEFCIPVAGTKVPAGPEWRHEIKYDGYRWEVGDVVVLVEATDAKPGMRGPYKKQMVL